ncbi:hypothetical protein, conserved [Pediculus humanus corporis]|uniref:Uncharacterized protein n=1 Tax=Pediculus humanus subsp. corporis TaxID=121224 RepID=E0VGS5_PEDHC|nr:uncharacterized protein Phum_PHUM191800 [Pediculus humanus corporis]EEB12581.1 hypothetical protein, conserved [Pediculus humanus corporis]
MDLDIKSYIDKYVEAETASEDSDLSSRSNASNGTTEVNHFLEGITKVKNLIHELENNFRETNNISNHLMLRCVLLRTENQNLIFKIDQKENLTQQLNKTRETLEEFQYESESNIENNLSSTANSYEALFLQEKLRCSKLMYEKLKLQNEIKNLQDKIRRHKINPCQINTTITTTTTTSNKKINNNNYNSNNNINNNSNCNYNYNHNNNNNVKNYIINKIIKESTV